MSAIKIEKLNHRGQDRLVLRYVYDEDINKLVRKIPGRTFSKSLRSWHLPDSSQSYKRKRSYLPEILSENEIKRLIRSYNNLKHRTIIMTFYACGLRKSELINLKLKDIDGHRKVIRIKNSKGAKDRDVALPDTLLAMFRKYYTLYKPEIYLFNGQKKPQYAASSIDKLIKQGLKRCGIKKKITAHNLRHSYATHLVEKNINLRYIQEALGYKSSRTTELYTRLSKEHIAQMVSPIDFWNEIIPTSTSSKGVDNIPKSDIKPSF